MQLCCEYEQDELRKNNEDLLYLDVKETIRKFSEKGGITNGTKRNHG